MSEEYDVVIERQEVWPVYFIELKDRELCIIKISKKLFEKYQSIEKQYIEMQNDLKKLYKEQENNQEEVNKRVDREIKEFLKKEFGEEI